MSYDKVSLLLPMFGEDNGTAFPDFSPVPKTVTPVGNTKTVTSESKYYGSSAFFNGTGDALVVTASTDFAFGTGDFTIEFWGYFVGITNFGTIYIHSSQSGSVQLFFVSGKLRLNNNTVAAVLDTATDIPTGQWMHFAVARQGTLVKWYLNGVNDSSGTDSTNFGGGTVDLTLGYDPVNSGRAIHAYIQDLRITKGVARYTANFTPPPRLIGQIGGTITDDAGQPAVRKIVAFPRVAPLRTFTTDSAADGTYSLQVPAIEHSRIALDDDGGVLYNDLIDRVIPQ
jgi:hypothetical protein